MGPAHQLYKNAVVYVMNLDYDYHIPSKEYIETCKRGFKCFRFDTNLLDKALIDTKSCIKQGKVKVKK